MNYKRTKPRTKSRSGRWVCGSRAGEAPAHWNILYHSRPRRRDDKYICRKILKDELHPDDAIWSLGNRKPHQYYW